MKKKLLGIFVCMLLITTVLPATGVINGTELVTYPATRQERDYGDAPEGTQAVAYPSLGVMGSFPTCKSIGPSGWVQHDNYGAYFGQGYDFEGDGNGGLCPGGFPPYDKDETFQDGDAGLIMPEPFTIDSTITVVPFTGYTGTPLGFPGQTVVWGTDIDIFVHNTMPGHEPYLDAFVNLIIDWNQNGFWGDPGEHVLVNFIVPALYIGPLSALSPPNFVIGPNPGYVWVRFSITEKAVPMNWEGEGDFEDGESECYLLFVDEDTPPEPKLECRGSLSWTNVDPGATVTGTFEIRNNGDPGSLLNWHVDSDPSYGTWSYSPPSGTNLAPSSWITITATCVSPNVGSSTFTGDIIVCNSDDPTECCIIPTSLTTPRNRAFNINLPFLRFLEQHPHMFPILRTLLEL